MRIISLAIKNKYYGWELEEVAFPNNITLLVGASGVGKTQILQAIKELRNIANGASVNGLEWKVIFSISDEIYLWEGKFNLEDDSEKKSATPNIQYEKLEKNKNVIIDRQNGIIKYNGLTMPKLSINRSMIYTLQGETSMQKVVDNINKILFKSFAPNDTFSDVNLDRYAPLTYIPNESWFDSLFESNSEYSTFERLKNAILPILVKISIADKKKFHIFKDIKNRFIDIFPQVEDVKVIAYPGQLSIKEKDVDKWITEDRMSSGMLRTFMHLCEIFLSGAGSVILIDEFENSLGVNCLDILTHDIFHERQDLQFIITSHHPFVINNIPFEYWKIVKRKAGKIIVTNPEEYHLGRSRQDAFNQLNKILEETYA